MERKNYMLGVMLVLTCTCCASESKSITEATELYSSMLTYKSTTENLELYMYDTTESFYMLTENTENMTDPSFEQTMPRKAKMWSFLDLLTKDLRKDIGYVENLSAEFNLTDRISKFNNTLQRDIVSIQLRYCPYTDLCTTSSLLQLDWPFESCCSPCSCDLATCERDRTCCPDIVALGDMSTASLEQHDTILKTNKDQQATIRKDVVRKCLPLALKGYALHVFAAAECAEFSSLYSLKCTRTYTSDIEFLADIVPCVSKRSGEIYRNRFCAYCNNITDNDIEFFEPTLECVSAPNLGGISDSEKLIKAVLFDSEYSDCEIEFNAKNDFFPLPYCTPSINKCNETGLWIDYSSEVETACHLYSSLINYGQKIYQNIFCVICNGFDADIYQSACSTFASIESEFTISFSGLLKIESFEEKGKKDTSSLENCSENQIFDKIQMKCLAVFCPKHFIVKDGKCQFMFSGIPEAFYKIYLKLTPVSPEKYGSLNSRDIFENIERFVQNTGGFISDMDLYCNINNTTPNDNKDAFIIYCNLNLDIHSTRYDYIDVVSSKVTILHSSFITTSNIWTDKNYKSGLFKVEVLSKPPLHTLNNENNSTEIYVDSFFRSDVRRDYSVMHAPVLIDLVSPLSCPLVNISKSNLHLKNNTGEILAMTEGFEIQKGQWYTDGDFVYICAEEYQRYQNYIQSDPPIQNPFMHSEVIVSIVCSFLSILAILLILITYLVHSNLRQTIPGKNLMSLCGSLMLAQISYLIVNFGGLKALSMPCKAAGMLLHFFLLLFVFWMNVCTFHMFRVFTRTRQLSTGSGVKRFALYLLYTVGCSIICLGINVLVSNQYYGHTGYGQQACYISSQELLYITFALPLAFVIVSNLGMFIAVIIRIKRTGSVTRNVQNERNDIAVFAKLSTITGATWIFGFIYIWTNIVVFSYIFIVLNASQGLLLCFAFVVNKRVWKMYKELSSQSRRSGESSSRSRQTTPTSC